MSKKADKYSSQRECRLLKAAGLSDQELLDRGFDRNTIQRSILSTGGKRGAVQPKGKCSECHYLYFFLKQGDVCAACRLRAKIKKEGRQQPEAYEPVKKGRPAITKPLNFDHPDIIKPKGNA
jgi:hypothetical protein